MILSEFQELIRPLNEEEYKALEKSVLDEGCRDSLVMWNGFIIDGHHRYKICKEHNIDFKTLSLEFEGKEKVKLWIINNQLARRNLKPKECAELRGLKYSLEKEAPGNPNLQLGQNVPIGKRREEIGDEEGVSYRTLARDERFAKATQSLKDNVGKEAREKALIDKTPKSQIIEIVKEYTPDEQKEIFELSEKKDYSLGRAKKEYHQKKIKEEKKAEPIPEGKYQVIYADPPWLYDFSKSISRDIENKYPTLNLEEIKEIDLPLAENAVLLLWSTAPKIQEALDVMKSWGFVYKSQFVWDKEIIGMGYWVRGQHELLLIGTKGWFPPPESEDRYSSVIREKRTEHSKKPDIVYDMIEKMFPGEKYLELFARKQHNNNWTVWGNEL